ncbi:MAG: VTT domain-containing protein [Actinomycetaceae bacterium]|nr:VTT domain-containing protein [Actinomycetaceae bacterium]
MSNGLIDYLHNPEALLLALGPYVLVGVALIVFVESGLLFPFLPGDSLLFTAGLLHVQLGLNLGVLIGVVIVAAVGGDQAGYWIGRRFGRHLFKPDARVLKTEYLQEAEEFFTKWGGPALTLARFVPIVRTFIPVAAGIAKMHYNQFFRWNVFGGVLWGGGMTILGVWLGQIPFVRNNIEIMAILVVLISVVPIAIGALRSYLKKRAA